MQIALANFLTPEQMQSYQALSQKGRKRSVADMEGGDFQPGVVWILRDGQTHKIRVRVGIADLQYSEIVSNALQASDLVIVRAQRVSE